MSSLDLKRGVLFIHVPRTAGSSMETFFGGKSHAPLGQYRAAFGDELDKLFKFSFVRHPLDRFVSAYFYDCDDFERYGPGRFEPTKADFGRFVRVVAGMDLKIDKPMTRYWPRSWQIHPHFIPQRLFLGPEMDFIGRFENLSDDWAEVCRRIGVEWELPHKRPSCRERGWRRYYTPETAEIVRRIYAEDLRRFGYE